MTKSEKAVSEFNKGYNCAQSVFSAFNEVSEVDEDLSRSIASGFGGGLGRLQETCGAVSGAIMVIGCRFFKGDQWPASKEVIYKKTREFIEKFKQRNNTINCLELIGVNLNTEEGTRIAKEKKLFSVKCERYIKDACEILEEII
ncbi:MAG: C-GCAxxG-C-C family protein [Actinomycetota bacterium]